MAALQTLATELGLTILVLHHNRKAPSADDPFDELNATTGFLGAADGGMILRRTRGEDKAVLHITGRDLEEDIALALQFDRAMALWYLAGGAAEHQISEARQQVIAVLQQSGIPMTPKNIAETLGLPEATIRQRCKRMADDGVIVNEGGGRYRLSSALSH
jgi:Predicted transcriptional regulator